MCGGAWAALQLWGLACNLRQLAGAVLPTRLGGYPELLVLLLRQGPQVELDAHMLAQHHLQQEQLVGVLRWSRHRPGLPSGLPGVVLLTR